MENLSPTHLASDLIEKIGPHAALGLAMNMGDAFSEYDNGNVQDVAKKFIDSDREKAEAFVFCAIIGSSLVVEALKTMYSK
jgi:hypothetical protein